jgi:ERCC4-type nuclease
MVIVCDNREERNKKKESEKQYIFNALKDKCKEVEQKQLEIGDYLLDNGFVIERKEDDLIQSITSKRIWEQLSNLQQYPHPILAITIQNLWKSMYFTNSRWIHTAYTGFLTTLMVSYPNLKVVFFEDTEEFVRFVVSLDKKIHDEGTSERPKMLQRKCLTQNDRIENVLTGVKGISVRTAKKILQEKSSIKAVCDSTKEELMEIPDIGEKTAKDIIDTLCGEYEKKD